MEHKGEDGQEVEVEAGSPNFLCEIPDFVRFYGCHPASDFFSHASVAESRPPHGDDDDRNHELRKQGGDRKGSLARLQQGKEQASVGEETRVQAVSQQSI